MDKKKLISSELQSWHCFIPLFAIVFVMFSFILPGNSYAISNNEYSFYLNSYVDNYPDNLTDKSNLLLSYSDLSDLLLNNNDDIDNYNYICFCIQIVGNQGYISYYLSNYNDNVILFSNRGSLFLYNILTNSNNNIILVSRYFNTSTTTDFSYSLLTGNNAKFCNVGGNHSGVCYWGLFPTLNIKTGNNKDIDVTYSDYFTTNYNNDYYDTISYIPLPTNTITLQAGLNSFHRYQGVGDKEQLIVYLDGYVTEDFTFFVEQYIDNEWQIATGINDYYFLYDEQNNDIYRNPYYITFTYLSGLPAGTCRYTALLNDNPETAFHSDTFTITPWSIGNDATGTVDSNGDIDISIDTGNTVEGIADFLSQDPTVTQEQFSDNFPTVEVDDPSEDFFSWIFDQIENIFTSTSAQILQFDLFGTTYSYSSNDVYVPNNTLKTFIGLYCDFSICMWIIKDVRKVINKIKEGNIEALSDEDITANMV